MEFDVSPGVALKDDISVDNDILVISQVSDNFIVDDIVVAKPYDVEQGGRGGEETDYTEASVYSRSDVPSVVNMTIITQRHP